MSNTHTVTITIGRKVGTKEMDIQSWLSFKGSILIALETYAGATILQRPAMGRMRAHDQVGEWEGQAEPAATFVGTMSGYHRMRDLREELAFLASAYGQDTIGCIITLGTDHLVPSVDVEQLHGEVP